MRKILITLLLLAANHVCFSQSFAFHLSSPLGMVGKIGAKAELRFGDESILLCGTYYYPTFFVFNFSGPQIAIEYRMYGFGSTGEYGQNYLYGKALGGSQGAIPASDGFFGHEAIKETSYYGLGGGVGRHLNYGAFFIDINAGLKFAYCPDPPIGFYVLGSGAIVDLHLNLGLQSFTGQTHRFY